jgi:hypothetical protein
MRIKTACLLFKKHLLRLACASKLMAVLTLALAEQATADTWTPIGAGWSRYTNERFGTVAEVPLHLFNLVEPPPENGDGRTYKSKDGAELRIFGSYGPVTVTERLA